MSEILFAPVVLTFFISLAVTWLARSGGVLDFPEHRSLHSKPTPRSGGLGILAGFGAGALVLSAAPVSTGLLLPILIFSAILGLIGLFDDLFALGSRIKFAVMAALCLAASGWIGPVTALTITHEISLGLPWGLGMAGSALFLFTMINATNFMDGSDGMLAAVMIPAGLGLAVAGLVAGVLATSFSGLLLAVGLLGFVLWNWPPARVFAGDAGSLFVGSVYAISALAMAGKGFAGSVWLAPLFALVFLTDVLLTLLRRVRQGRFNLNAHSEHAYQRLVKSGWSHARVALLYGGLTCAIIITGLLAAQGPEWAPFVVFLIWCFVLSFGYRWTDRLTATT